MPKTKARTDIVQLHPVDITTTDEELSGWLSPDGDWYPTEKFSHRYVRAHLQLQLGIPDLEDDRWTIVADGFVINTRGFRLTEEQKATL